MIHFQLLPTPHFCDAVTFGFGAVCLPRFVWRRQGERRVPCGLGLGLRDGIVSVYMEEPEAEG